MKRIALVCFILFAVPLIFTECKRESSDKEYYWTYSEILNHIVTPDKTRVYLANDTVSEDTITASLLFIKDNFPDLGPQKNPITMFNFDITIDGIVDKSSLKALKVYLVNGKYNWPGEKVQFLYYFRSILPANVDVSFLSPHNSKDIQFVTWAIKENGDTLKAVSQTVFCK